MPSPKIFVSHSSLDLQFASRVVTDLNRAGAHAWLDKDDLGAGNFQQNISAALDGCEWFLLVLTRNALASKWVRQEVDAANIRKHQGRIKELMFIKAAQVNYEELPAFWSVYNIFDATMHYDAALQRILKEVGIEATSDQSTSTHSASSQTDTYVDATLNGSQLLRARRYGEAVPYLERATQFPQASATDWGNLGYAYNRCGRWHDGLDAHNAALALNDDLAWVWANMGDALFGLKRYEEAVQCYKQGLSISDNGNRRHSLAKALRMLGRSDEASKVLDNQACD